MNKQSFRHRASCWIKGLLLGIAFCSAGVASAGPLNYANTTLGGPTWNRPLFDDLGTLSEAGSAVPYHAQILNFAVAGSYDFVATPLGQGDGSWDLVAFLYETSFDPQAPLINVIYGSNGDMLFDPSMFTVADIQAGTYVLVITGFNNTNPETQAVDAGEFEVTIDGGNEVPEPASLLLVGIALLSLGAASRRRQR